MGAFWRTRSGGYHVRGVFFKPAEGGRSGGDCASVGAVEQGCELCLVRCPCAGSVYEGRGDLDAAYGDHGVLGRRAETRIDTTHVTREHLDRDKIRSR